MVLENVEKIRPVGIRRNSTGSLDINTSQEIYLPTYLKDSIGSCHDYCKYGVKREFATKARTPFLKRPPIAPDKSPGLGKNENVGISRLSSNVKNSTSQVNGDVIRQKKKEKTITPKYSNELKLKSSKLEVSCGLAGQAPSSRHSDVCIQTGNFRNRWSHDGKNAGKGKPEFIVSKKVDGVPAPTFRSAKPDLRNKPKHPSSSRNKLNKALHKTEPEIVENPVEKILYVAEMTTSKEEVASIADHSRIQLLSEERNDPSEDKHPALSLPHNTEDMSYNDKEIDFTKFSSSFSSPGDSINSTKDEGSSISSCITDSDGSPRKLKSKKGKKANAEDKGNIMRNLEDDSESIKTSQESIEVVLEHQSPEDKRQSKNLYNAVIEEKARELLKTRKSKVKALVGAFEALISLEDKY